MRGDNPYWGGMPYVRSGRSDGTISKLRDKLKRARAFAEVTFPGDYLHFEIWSPRVAKGKLTDAFDVLKVETEAQDRDLGLVVKRRL